jgi:F-type H+-transporting ATPase subunit delta
MSKAPAEHVRLDVRNEQVARVYAEALYNAAQKQGKADPVLQQLVNLIDDVFGADPLLEKFLASRAIRRDVKRSAIDRAFGSQADAMIVDFLQVLNNHERLGLLRTIVQQYRELNDERTRKLRVKVRAAAALTTQQEDRLKAEIKATYNMEPILNVKVDPDLLGGMVVQVGDWLYDSTVKSRLERLRNQLMAGSYHVQDGRDQLSTTA